MNILKQAEEKLAKKKLDPASSPIMLSKFSKALVTQSSCLLSFACLCVFIFHYLFIFNFLKRNRSSSPFL